MGRRTGREKGRKEGNFELDLLGNLQKRGAKKENEAITTKKRKERKITPGRGSNL